MFPLLCALLFLNLQSINAQLCGVTIDDISVPDGAPTDADGNYIANEDGSEDALYKQESTPNASLPNVSYVIEFSNGKPLLINETGEWSTTEQELKYGDVVKVRAFAYDLDSINLALGVAGDLCIPDPLLDGIFPDVMPCAQIIPLVEGNPDTGDLPGLQGLGEALDLATAITGTTIFSADTAVAVLNELNIAIAIVPLGVCFNSSNVYEVYIGGVGTGIYDNYELVNIYPNPNNGVFTVQLPDLKQLEVFNHIGQAVDFKLDGNKVALNNATKGLYFVKASAGNKSYMAKITVE